MTEKSLTISVQCPKSDCKKQKKIDVPKYLFDNKKFGTLKIQIHAGVCCEHEFIAFVDRKGNVRGYEFIDKSIDLSEYADRIVGKKIYLRDLLKQYGSNAVATIFHSLLLDIDIYLLENEGQPAHVSKINALIKEYLPEELRSSVSLVHSLEIKNFKKAKLGEATVISPEGVVINQPWFNVMLEFENKILWEALDILDDEAQSIIIQEEIKNLFEKVKFIQEFVSKRTTPIYEDELREILEREFSNEQFSDNDMMLYKQILKFRVKANVDMIKIRSFDKLVEGLW